MNDSRFRVLSVKDTDRPNTTIWSVVTSTLNIDTRTGRNWALTLHLDEPVDLDQEYWQVQELHDNLSDAIASRLRHEAIFPEQVRENQTGLIHITPKS